MSDKSRSTSETVRLLRESIDASISGDHKLAAELLDELDEWDRCTRCGAVLDRDKPRGPAGADHCWDCDTKPSNPEPKERYFRFDIEPADAYLGDPGDPCDFENCDAGGAYHVAVELQGNHSEQLACVDHVEHMANALMMAVNASVRVTLDNEIGKDEQ